MLMNIDKVPMAKLFKISHEYTWVSVATNWVDCLWMNNVCDSESPAQVGHPADN